jgi:predicted nuclease with RNAse H fold
MLAMEDLISLLQIISSLLFLTRTRIGHPVIKYERRHNEQLKPVTVVVLSRPNVMKEDLRVVAVRRRLLNAVIETHPRSSRFCQSSRNKMLIEVGKTRLQLTLWMA